MRRPTVVGLVGGMIVLTALVGVTARSAAPEDRQAAKGKKTGKAKGGSPAVALRALTSLQGASGFGERGDYFTQTLETPYTTAYTVIHLEFRDADACQRFKAEGAQVFNRFERFADLFINSGKNLNDVLFKDANHGIVWFDFATRAVAPPPRPTTRSTERARGVADIIRNGFADLNGKGVIVAVIDTGIDFRHPDFVTYDEEKKPTSRLLHYWDTTSDTYAEQVGSKGPISYPNGASVGTVYSREDLTKELRAGNPRIHVWDIDGHGTACASIAAGNGNALDDRRYAGVAPQAELIAVRIQDRGPSLENAYLLNAICGWIDDMARKEGKPVVISCSFGGHAGGHDGYRVDERQLNARFPTSAQGRAICVAAGNEAYRRIHAAVTCGPDSKGVLKWLAFQESLVSIYTDASSRADVELEGDQAKSASRYVHGLTGKLVISARVPSGRGELRLVSKSGQTVHADAYITAGNDPREGFDDSCRVAGKQIGTPATSSQAITVGSYDFSNEFEAQGKPLYLKARNRRGELAPMVPGTISGYSNAGPSRLGDTVKPELVAPGQFWTAAAALNTQAYIARDTSGKYQAFNGTSAATPYAAGVVALMLQKKPTLTLGEIKGLLREHADKDDDQVLRGGSVPNAEWGHGKLNRKAVKAILDAIR